MSPEDNGWQAYKLMILSDLQRLDHSFELLQNTLGEMRSEMHKEFSSLKTDLTALKARDVVKREAKIQQGALGFLGGSMVIGIMEALKFLMR